MTKKTANQAPACERADMDLLREAAAAIIAWDRENRRSLPWRDDPAPYHVWISEIMLQQTRIETVIPYYRRFMERFPSVEALAGAEEAEILKLLRLRPV